MNATSSEYVKESSYGHLSDGGHLYHEPKYEFIKNEAEIEFKDEFDSSLEYEAEQNINQGIFKHDEYFHSLEEVSGNCIRETTSVERKTCDNSRPIYNLINEVMIKDVHSMKASKDLQDVLMLNICNQPSIVKHGVADHREQENSLFEVPYCNRTLPETEKPKPERCEYIALENTDLIFKMKGSSSDYVKESSNRHLSDGGHLYHKPKYDFIKNEEEIEFKDEFDSSLQNETGQSINQGIYKYDESFHSLEEARGNCIKETTSVERKMCDDSRPIYNLIKEVTIKNEVRSTLGPTDLQDVRMLNISNEPSNFKHGVVDQREQENFLFEVTYPNRTLAEREQRKPELCVTMGRMVEHGTVHEENLAVDITTCMSEKIYKCNICRYSSVQKSHLVQHIRCHSEAKNPFTCKLCDYITRRKATLNLHMKTHTGEKPFKCELCDYTTRRKATLNLHIKTHTGEKPFKCELCSYSAAEKHKVVRHIKIHTRVKPFKCEHCSYSALTRIRIMEHTRIHTGEKPFKCEFCEHCASTKISLQYHVQTHTREKPFKCELCQHTASTKTSLQYHIRTHTGENLFKCELCNYSAMTRPSLVQHIRSHIGEKPFRCELCDYSAVAKTSLVRHTRTHSNEKPFQCKICGFSSVHRESLVKHIVSHSRVNPFKCEMCDYSTRRKACLGRHIRTHAGAKPFKCELCDYSASEKGRLVRHLRTHTGEKRFKCEHCGYCAFHKCRLVEHSRIHTADKPYTCGICLYGTSKKCSLGRHIRTHTV